MTEAHQDVDHYLQRATAGDDPFASFIAHSSAEGLPEIQVSAVFGRLLELLVRVISARLVVEVGTLGGYSSAWMARGMGPGGRVVTLEIDPHHAEVATANLRGVDLADAVEIRVGPALDSLAAMATESAVAGHVDLAFIDADKSNNPRYVAAAADLVRPGGLIIVDNVVRNGTVVDATSADGNVVGSRGALELLGSLPHLTATALQTVGVKGWDGFAIALVGERA